jgi:hypothetical protein
MEAGPGRPIRIRHCSSSWVLCKPVFRDPLMADRSQIRLRTALPRPRNFLHNRAEHSNCENNPHEVHRQSSPVPISTNSRVAGGASGEVCETAQQDWMVTVFPLHGLSESLRLVLGAIHLGRIARMMRAGQRLGSHIVCRRRLFKIEGFSVRVRFDPDRFLQPTILTAIDGRQRQLLFEEPNPLESGMLHGEFGDGGVALHRVSVPAPTRRACSIRHVTSVFARLRDCGDLSLVRPRLSWLRLDRVERRFFHQRLHISEPLLVPSNVNLCAVVNG